MKELNATFAELDHLIFDGAIAENGALSIA